MRMHTVPASRCPACGSRHDAATNVLGVDGPEPGDVTVCWECAAVLVYGDRLHITLPSAAMRDRLLADPDIARLVAVVRSRR